MLAAVAHSALYLGSALTLATPTSVAAGDFKPSAAQTPQGCQWNDDFAFEPWRLFCRDGAGPWRDTGKRIKREGGAIYTVVLAPPPAPVVQPPPGVYAKRDPGPGCIPYSTYATNCQTPEQRRVALGIPTVEQERIDRLKEEKAQRLADAAEAADLARAVPADPATRRCAQLAFRQISAVDRDAGLPRTVYHSVNGMENGCNYPVQFKVEAGGHLRWETVLPGRWVQFDDIDQWTGVVRRAKE